MPSSMALSGIHFGNPVTYIVTALTFNPTLCGTDKVVTFNFVPSPYSETWGGIPYTLDPYIEALTMLISPPPGARLRGTRSLLPHPYLQAGRVSRLHAARSVGWEIRDPGRSITGTHRVKTFETARCGALGTAWAGAVVNQH